MQSHLIDAKQVHFIYDLKSNSDPNDVSKSSIEPNDPSRSITPASKHFDQQFDKIRELQIIPEDISLPLESKNNNEMKMRSQTIKVKPKRDSSVMSLELLQSE